MADQMMAADKSRLKGPRLKDPQLKDQSGALSKADLAMVEDAVALHLGMKR